MDSTIAKNEKIDESNGIYKDILVAFSLIIGSLASILAAYIIVLISRKPKPLHMDTVLSLVIIVLGFIGSLSQIARAIMMKWPFNQFIYYDSACSVEYMTSSLFNLICVYPIALLSIERMLLILFKISLSKKVWLFLLIFFMTLHFTFQLTASIQRKFLFSPISMGCISNPHSSLSFVTRYLAISYITCFFIVTINYVCIMIFQFRRGIITEHELQLDHNIIKKQNYKLLFRASLIVTVFVVSYVGKVSVWCYQWATGLDRPWNLDYIANLLFLLHNFSNCLLVLYLDQKSSVIIVNKLKKLVKK
ncbi:hypothetical protein CONCODRAFT_4267 [Conidiobolus coronatus NRRL 28638]|uniref:G-protein coupled receptors family 1 profile domain-containing protein n=1 Tax=Conidiobolus coronatus (strain ATCC 28846 / CBS 209.66 / NRRL 28638) TaxID=796925 RepID=A0A137PCZ5_CONC2|nr:hypothetical protein CONCODRAFT_4267 [Conidiobolus coronatus NRRL 28638]|eukprot:KXN72874.1 hypothetical protein CONCODRAFT_4267 [Conidiobolus coronatus NRRL 28638]